MTRAQRRRNTFLKEKRKAVVRSMVKERGKWVSAEAPARNDERAKQSFTEQKREFDLALIDAVSYSRVCVLCGKTDFVEKVRARSVESAFFDLGWRYDNVEGGCVCLSCSVHSGLMFQKRRFAR